MVSLVYASTTHLPFHYIYSSIPVLPVSVHISRYTQVSLLLSIYLVNRLYPRINFNNNRCHHPIILTMSVSPTLSTTSSFSSFSSSSSTSEYNTQISVASSKCPSPALRKKRPTHKRTISEFSIQRSNKIRKTVQRNKNILLWPSQLHSLNVASQEAKQRANTPTMSRQSSTEPHVSIQADSVLLGYMELLQRQRKENLTSCSSLSASSK